MTEPKPIATPRRAAIVFIFITVALTLTYAAFVGAEGGAHLPGAPFLLATLLLLGALAVAWRVTRPGRT